MRTEPTVSIITASYNHAPFIGEAIESLQRQNYDSWELLIADDSSTDHTLDVLTSYADDTRIRVFPFEINREHHMRNFAAKHARGEYIGFLNSDDIFLPGKLRKQVDYLDENPNIAAVFTHVKCIDENGKSLPNHRLEEILTAENRPRHQWLRHFFVAGNCLCISSALIRRSCFESVGAFDPMLIQTADLELWIKTCFRWDIHVIADRLTAMRLLGGSRNLSTPSPASLSRLMIEYGRAYDHYFTSGGLDQLLEIFPELRNTLPEDVPQWRHYLLCRIATFLSGKPERLAGFVKLHELLSEEESRDLLLKRNRRLLRAVFLSEGTASLWQDCPGVTWQVYLPRRDGSYRREESHSYWTTAVDGEVVCLSFPNPGTSGRLCLVMGANQTLSTCRRFRLYNPETGDVIFDSGRFRPHDASAAGKTTIELTRLDPVSGQPGADPHFYFPRIDFTVPSSKWIDLEIEIETEHAPAPAPPQSCLSRIRRFLDKRLTPQQYH